MTPLIYMLESDADDRLLTEEILGELEVPLHISFFSHSEALLKAVEAQPPALLIIEDNSVPHGALELLETLKSLPRSVEIPVVVLMENAARSYANACYAKGAATVVRKPLNMAGTKKKISLFFQYWLEVAII